MNYLQATTELLNKISQIPRGPEYKMTCQYIDGKGLSLMEVVFRFQHKRTYSGKIVFNAATGEVLYFRYPQVSLTGVDTIIDALLDIFTLEQKLPAPPLAKPEPTS